MFHYQCTDCNQIFDIKPEIMLCSSCGPKTKKNSPSRGVLEVINSNKNADLQDFFTFLPIEKTYFPSLQVGNTPLVKPERLMDDLRLANLFIKNDSTNPTGSFKDRASFLVSAFAKNNNINEIVLASTGNAGSSMAGIGACANQKITIFLPKNVPEGKLIQSLQYGANVIMVDGNYDLAYDLSIEYSKKFGGMNRNTAYNPMTIEGKKTVSLEIVRDLGTVDHIFIPTGDGVILAGVYKGFIDLLNFKIIKKIPTIYAVQAEFSGAIHRAFKNGGTFDYQRSNTIADSISVDAPRNGHLAYKYLTKYNGKTILVTDDEILNAQKILSTKTGLFIEPAGAASLAGLLKVKDSLKKNETIVLLATGNGLKDTLSATKKITKPQKLIKNIAELT
ncbi:MAG: threonine synthase [Bdellovibrionales bacterium RIFOXYB1_FULL_37_110]|nr:MAG: threonine synthase [Bdellovibrionales bacterium RIFOXYC1_FULL_37_79]OFZ57130.1 MAG: threonine synthase [Bdellovibrionales bacterium RIFOXYB1_FULL_37_110]OFZ65386.1 MAG: threonine synthase [Bdellovibrionales bacterium RIFOXYD1_FULL_36_51]